MSQSYAPQTLQMDLNEMLALERDLREAVDRQGESEAVLQRHLRHRRRDVAGGRGKMKPDGKLRRPPEQGRAMR